MVRNFKFAVMGDHRALDDGQTQADAALAATAKRLSRAALRAQHDGGKAWTVVPHRNRWSASEDHGDGGIRWRVFYRVLDKISQGPKNIVPCPNDLNRYFAAQNFDRAAFGDGKGCKKADDLSRHFPELDYVVGLEPNAVQPHSVEQLLDQ